MRALLASYRAECLKLLWRPLNWGLAVFVVGFVVGFGYSFNYFEWAHPAAGFHSSTGLSPAQLISSCSRSLRPTGSAHDGVRPERRRRDPAGRIPGWGAEFGWGTLKTVATMRPGRVQLVSGHLLAVATCAGGLVLLWSRRPWSQPGRCKGGTWRDSSLRTAECRCHN